MTYIETRAEAQRIANATGKPRTIVQFLDKDGYAIIAHVSSAQVETLRGIEILDKVTPLEGAE